MTKRLLFVKMSSLGDVVHFFPAVTDARRAFPDARVDWVVEQPYAALVQLHPGVDVAIPSATRRWRSALSKRGTWEDIARFLRSVRAAPYDAVVDAQGLIRSGVVTRFARGTRHGYDLGSVRERAASLLYETRHPVSRAMHAIDRNRSLTGKALGYQVSGPPDYGLDRAALQHADAGSYAVLLHGTARPEKQWPGENWIVLARELAARGVRPVFPSGSEEEQRRAHSIAAEVSGAEVLPLMPLHHCARLLASAALVVGVDTGLLHLAAALQVPLVGIYISTDPALVGPVGQGPIIVVQADRSRADVERVLAGVRQVRPETGEEAS